MAETRGRPIAGRGLLVDQFGKPTGQKPPTLDARELAEEEDEDSKYHVYTQLASIQYKVDWTKPDVDDVIRQHELGYFQGSALLADSMTRDDCVDAVLDTQVLGLLGLDRIVKPSKKGNLRGNKKIAALIDDRFLEFFPREVLAPLTRWAILMGFAVAQKIWRPNEDGTEWVPELEVWHPAFTYVRIDTMQYFVITTEGVVEIEPDSPQWLLYTPNGRRYAWMTGAIRSIATPWLARLYTWRDWLRSNELWALGLTKAIVPAKASEASKKKFYGQVANRGSNATALCPQDKDGSGNSYDVETLFPPGNNTGEGNEKLMSKAEAKIAIRINGQTLTTEVKGASLAAARVHENVKQDILEARSNSLGECLSTQVIQQYIDFHDYPANTNAPDCSWNVDPPEDSVQKADTTGKVADALVKFKTQANAPVDERALLEKFDIPLLAAGSTNQPAPTPATPGAPGAPGAPAPHSPATPPGTPTDNELAAMVMALAAHLPRGAGADARRYIDDVAGSATNEGRKALRTDLVAMKKAIQGASSLEDARARVVAAFHKMDPARLARITHAATAMAHAAGFHAAHEETGT